MCGRFEVHSSPQILMLYFLLAREPAGLQDKEYRPTDEALIVRVCDGERLALPARWRLIPPWAKDATIAQHTFNARAETIAEKPSYRSAFQRRRCIVPMTSFFEWRTVTGQTKKQRLRFARTDGEPLAIAGLWERWDGSSDGRARETFTVITTAANDFMTPIHDRMPAILAKPDWDAWLDPDLTDPNLLKPMLAPCPNDWLKWTIT